MSKSKHWWGPNADDDHEDSDAGSKKSGKSGVSRKSSAAFFYPPLTPPATAAASSSSTSKDAAGSQFLMSSGEPPPPVPAIGPLPLSRHPYQAYYGPGLYDYHSSSTPPNAIASGGSGVNSRSQLPGSTTDADLNKSYDNDKNAVTAGVHPSTRTSSALPLPTTHQQRNSSFISRLRLLLLLLLFLPLPPLLSLIYLAIGHSILRASHSHPSSWSSHSLLSSVNAGATGGIILALPVFVLFFLFLPSKSLATLPIPSVFASGAGSTAQQGGRQQYQEQQQWQQQPQKSRLSRTTREDFFDDRLPGNSHQGITHLAPIVIKYVLCIIIVLGVGSAAGAIGVACLPESQNGGMLSPGEAAEAGIIGAVVFWPCLVIVGGLVGTAGLWVWNTWQSRELGEERANF